MELCMWMIPFQFASGKVWAGVESVTPNEPNCYYGTEYEGKEFPYR